MQVSNIFVLIADILLVAGSCILAGALFALQRVFSGQSPREIISRKYFLLIPILFFILEYLAYLATFWNTQRSWQDLVIPGMLFASACASWVMSRFFLRPTISFALAQGSISDSSLPGIYSRSYLERRLTAEIARAQRYSLPLSVFLLDIDQLKRVNVAYGYKSGDQMLIQLAKLLLEYVRESDEVARYDEDAMLVMAPNTSIHDAHLLAERIRQRVAVQPLLDPGTEKTGRIAIQVSIGVAAMQGGFDSLEKMLQRTEVALQHAQEAGGNCVVAFDPGVVKNNAI